jgi:putative sterol carrier protein
MSVRPVIESVVVRFNERVANDPELRKELAGLTKKVQLDLGQEKYYFVLKECSVPCVCDGVMAETPDITLFSDPETITKIVNGEMKMMKAWALKKVRLKGSIEDLMRFRKFL